MIENYTLVIPLTGGDIIFPEFTTTLSLPTIQMEPVWKKPEEVIEHLKKFGSPIKSKVSLLNYERKGLLNARRDSVKKVYYDLNEVEKLFKNKLK